MVKLIIKISLTGIIIFNFFLCSNIIGAEKYTFTQTEKYFQNQTSVSESENIDWVKSMTSRYSPNSWYLLKQYQELPSEVSCNLAGGGRISSRKTVDTFYYLKSKSKTELLSDMGTNVHEIAHAYFHLNVFQFAQENKLFLNWNNIEGFIYLFPDQNFYLSFPKDVLFPAGELSSEIPDSFRTFRYETYIGGNTSTQEYGIIGLIDELHAYYLGSRFEYEMLEAFKIAEESDIHGFFEWVRSVQSNLSAFYEFDFFIRKYLIFMKKEYPANYSKLKSYQPFVDSYRTIRTLYRDLLKKYMEKISEEIQYFNSTESSIARIDKNTLWIKFKKGIERGTPILSEDVEKLIPYLQSNIFQLIDSDFPE
jgi:hypothetical protein